MSPYCDELVQDFNDLLEDLTPTNDFDKEARQAANTIFQQLQQEGPNHGVRIGRTKIAGSVGKDTAIFYYDDDGDVVYPDLDLVVFVNDWKPPFEEVYDIFEDILEPLNVNNMRQTKFSLKFDIPTKSHGYLKVDLLAAENLVVNTWPYAGCDIGEIEAKMASLALDEKQKKAVRQTKSVDQLENKLLSSAFAENTVKIINNFVDDAFIEKQVFLAKYWIRNIKLSGFGYIPAKSAIAEAIAISAQKNRRSNRNGGRTCIISGFRRFLEKVERFQSLDICLTDDNQVGWKKYPKPMIRDPGNAWNNLAEGMPPGAMKVLEKQATKTLELLRDVRNKEGHYENAIDDIFDHKD